ncbi:MAG TPA: arginine deiminase family protein [Pyrinomonadaceae bacterium]|nr:arginine deiminase family protein [Pyrinomonadaceae bacterium]
MNIVALTREPARDMSACELTHLERRPIDAAWAAEQHRAYCDALRECGAQVFRLPPIDELPDSVFVEDTAIVLDELAVLTRPGVDSRRGEVEAIEPEVGRLRETVARVEPPATLEGGDVLRVGRRLFVGLSPRTNRAGVEALRAAVGPYGYEVVAVELRGCLHLKTGCASLGGDSVLVNKDWIDPRAFHGLEVVPVAAGEPFAANALSVGRTVCLGAQFTRTAQMLSSRGYDVRAVDVSEFAKAEAGLTCMSLIFNQ